MRLIYVDQPVTAATWQGLLGAATFGATRIHQSTLAEMMARQVEATGGRWLWQTATLETLPAVLAQRPLREKVIVWPARVVTLNAPKLAALLEKLAYARDALVIPVGRQKIYAGPAENFSLDLWREPGDAELTAWQREERQQGLLRLQHEDYLLALESMADLQQLFNVKIHARFFNALKAEGETVTKASGKVAKIRDEYALLSRLPAMLAPYFVPVKNYQESPQRASYAMPRVPMLDASVRYINGSLKGERLHALFAMLGRFFAVCGTTRRSAEAADFQFIYTKTEERLAELMRWPGYAALDELVRHHTPYAGLAAVQATLLAALQQARPQLLAAGSQFSHGDLCLSNILFDESIGLLQLIDPRGGRFEDSFRSPYYDWAKLAHSVVGGYDFIINGLARLEFDDAMQARVAWELPAADAASQLWTLAGQFGLAPGLIRLVEASLFLSMLPLHLDSTRKVNLLALRGVEVLQAALALGQAEGAVWAKPVAAKPGAVPQLRLVKGPVEGGAPAVVRFPGRQR